MKELNSLKQLIHDLSLQGLSKDQIRATLFLSGMASNIKKETLVLMLLNCLLEEKIPSRELSFAE